MFVVAIERHCLHHINCIECRVGKHLISAGLGWFFLLLLLLFGLYIWRMDRHRNPKPSVLPTILRCHKCVFIVMLCGVLVCQCPFEMSILFSSTNPLSILFVLFFCFSLLSPTFHGSSVDFVDLIKVYDFVCLSKN